MTYYVKTNPLGGVIDISIDSGNGGTVLESTEDLTGYLLTGLCASSGYPKYKIADGCIADRTEQEMAQENTQPTPEERIAALESAVLELITGGAE